MASIRSLAGARQLGVHHQITSGHFYESLLTLVKRLYEMPSACLLGACWQAVIGPASSFDYIITPPLRGPRLSTGVAAIAYTNALSTTTRLFADACKGGR